MCVGKVTILYDDHKIHVLLDEYRNKLKLVVDSETITDFSEVALWAGVRETTTKHMKILLIASQVEVNKLKQTLCLNTTISILGICLLSVSWCLSESAISQIRRAIGRTLWRL